MLGIVQEQHPDRARLFAQWKGLDWPILADPLNLLEVPYVPITLLIDEHGIIRGVNPPLSSASSLAADFVDPTYPAPDVLPDPVGLPDLVALKARAEPGGTHAWRDYGDAVLLWGGPEAVDLGIRAYMTSLVHDTENTWSHFRLGVGYRMRFDSDDRRDRDFHKAVRHWSLALDQDVNNYIYRRRIQQYGPRLDKPYPFYDWVPQAREEILSRGEIPVKLPVEPMGAEFAARAGAFETPVDAVEPDPDGKINRDEALIAPEITVVPPRITPGGSVRVHVALRPQESLKAHWNNEADPTELWVRVGSGWEASERRLDAPMPDCPLTIETRHFEFELSCPADAEPGQMARVPAYALYYVCEDITGICLYRRLDLNIDIPIVSKMP